MKPNRTTKRDVKMKITLLASSLAIASVFVCTPSHASNGNSGADALFSPVKSNKSSSRTLTSRAPRYVNKGAQTDNNESAKLRDLLKSTTIADQAFSKTAKDLMPMTPEQIKTLHYLFDRTQRAIAAGPGVDTPRPETTAVNVDLAPGAVPPVVRLSSGLVSSLIFMDSTSAPWTIEWYDIGDPKRFSVKSSKGGNTLMIQALSAYKSANIAIKLQGLSTPVMLTLLPGQQSVDYRVDLRIPGVGPNAVTENNEMATTSSPELLDVLNGIPPKDSKTLRVRGGQADAWLLNNKLYMRTRLTLLSPGWVSRMTSGDGTNAYELPNTPVVLVLDHGATVSLNLQEE